MITIEIYGLTPDTEYTLTWENNSKPGTIEEATVVDTTDYKGFTVFEAPRHSNKLTIELTGDRVIDL